MSKPKVPYQLSKIPVSNIKRLHVGETCIVGPAKAKAVSAEFSRTPGSYQQQTVLVIEPRTAQCVKMFQVTRLS